jgi:hypothetical protein
MTDKKYVFQLTEKEIRKIISALNFQNDVFEIIDKFESKLTGKKQHGRFNKPRRNKTGA